MFEGFTPKTGEFLWDLSFNNERTWFLAHKDEFEQVLNAPFKALAADVFAEMSARYPAQDWRLHVARIYRDARRLHGRGPYKDHLWFSFKGADIRSPEGSGIMDGPTFWFEIGPADYSCGMGFYSATPAQMAVFRRLIDANPARFERIVTAPALAPFALTGAEYKRPKAVREGVIARWYNRKNVGLELSRDYDELLYSPELVTALADNFARLLPIYGFFAEVYQTAAHEEQG